MQSARKKEIARLVFETSLSVDGIIWIGAEDPESPSRQLADWADAGAIDGVESPDQLDMFISREHLTGRLGFVVCFLMPVPRDFTFRPDGSPVCWTTGGFYQGKVFYRESLEQCFDAALEWAKAEFDAAMNKERTRKVK